MEDFELTKKPDLDIFDRRFPAMFDDPIYDPTKMTIIQGTDGVLDDLFSYQVYNKLKNHWRLDVAPADIQPGMIWSDSDNDKLYHHGAADEEILQTTRSGNQSPYFTDLYLEQYIYHTGDTHTYIRFQENQIYLRAGGITFINMVQAGTNYLQLLNGLNFIGDDENTKMTRGLTINQLGADDEILAFKSSDVDHGITDEAELDTYGLIKKGAATQGGVRLMGFRSTGGIPAIQLYAVTTDDDTTKTIAGRSIAEVRTGKKSGTAIGNVGADANIFGIRTWRGGAEETVFIVDEDGDTWQDGMVTATGIIFGAPTELTVDGGGVITVTRGYHRVDGAGDAADVLVTINGGVDGMILILRIENVGRPITLNETGNMELDGGVLFTMDTIEDKITLIYDASISKWCELSRSDNS